MGADSQARLAEGPVADSCPRRVTGFHHRTGTQLGLKASPTCELSFGLHGTPAVGHLVGGVHNGIAQMFTVIEHARVTIMHHPDVRRS